MTENEDVSIKEFKSKIAEQITKQCYDLAYAITIISNNESHLLDGIKLANEAVRSLATTIFVETQKAKKNDD